jgi:hypothetical protein
MKNIPSITSATYKQEIERLENGILDALPAFVGSKALLAEGIGNLLREFGEPGADEWFQRALEWHRQPEHLQEYALEADVVTSNSLRP